MNADAKLLRFKWLADKVVGAGVQALDDILRAEPVFGEQIFAAACFGEGIGNADAAQRRRDAGLGHFGFQPVQPQRIARAELQQPRALCRAGLQIARGFGSVLRGPGAPRWAP